MSAERAYTIKQGVVGRPMKGRLTQDNGRDFVSLSPTAGVEELHMRAKGIGTGAFFTGKCDIHDEGTPGTRGSWSYPFYDGDTLVADLYRLEWVIHYTDGSTDVVPNITTGQLRVEASLTA